MSVEPVRKTILVGGSPERAFAVFTEEIGAWWPVATHSVGEERAARAACEGGVDGRFYEIGRDGSEHEWGHILVWDPPRRLVTTWDPAHRGAETQIEVRFTPEGAGTRVDLEHRGWEALGELAGPLRSSYSARDGWTEVLSLYAAGASG